MVCSKRTNEWVSCAQKQVEIKWNEQEKKKESTTNRSTAIDRHVVNCFGPTLGFNEYERYIYRRKTTINSNHVCWVAGTAQIPFHCCFTMHIFAFSFLFLCHILWIYLFFTIKINWKTALNHNNMRRTMEKWRDVHDDGKKFSPEMIILRNRARRARHTHSSTHNGHAFTHNCSCNNKKSQ